MDGLRAAFAAETFKLWKKKKIIAAAILSILAVLVGQLAVAVVNASLGLRVVGSGEFPLIVLSFCGYTVFPLFVIFAAADMFNGEVSAHTMKLALTRPVSRFGVFSAKVGALAVFIAANLLFVLALSLAAGIAFNPSSLGFGGLIRVAVAYAVTFFPVFVFGLLVVLLANLVRGGLAVFFLSILLFVGFHAAGLFFSRFESFLVTSMFDWYRHWIAESVNLAKILRQALILLGCGMMLFAAGFWLFDRKEL